MSSYIYYLIKNNKNRRLHLHVTDNYFKYPLYITQKLNEKILYNGNEGNLTLVENISIDVIDEIYLNVCELNDSCRLVFNNDISFIESEYRLDFSLISKLFKNLLHEEKTSSPFMFIFSDIINPDNTTI